MKGGFSSRALHEVVVIVQIKGYMTESLLLGEGVV